MLILSIPRKCCRLIIERCYANSCRLDWGTTNLDWAADTLEGKFDGWNKAIKENLSPDKIPDKAKNTRAGPKAQEDVSKQNKDKMETADVKQNWTNYHLTHGGALNGSVVGKSHRCSNTIR